MVYSENGHRELSDRSDLLEGLVDTSGVSYDHPEIRSQGHELATGGLQEIGKIDSYYLFSLNSAEIEMEVMKSQKWQSDENQYKNREKLGEQNKQRGENE